LSAGSSSASAVREPKQLRQAPFVRIASRAISVRLDPFRVLGSQRIANIALKLRERLGVTWSWQFDRVHVITTRSV
jgi:hypothetical protein